jgi:putative transposase
MVVGGERGRAWGSVVTGDEVQAIPEPGFEIRSGADLVEFPADQDPVRGSYSRGKPALSRLRGPTTAFRLGGAHFVWGQQSLQQHAGRPVAEIAGADQGIACAPSRVRRIMAERGLKAIQPETFVPRTSGGRAAKPSPNLLEGKELSDCPDRVWAGDITFIPTAAGWLYLAVVIDLCTHRIVGWSLARPMRAGLASAALKPALETRRPGAGLVFPSDHGSHYGSRDFRAMLARAGAVQSMSERAHPSHNAWTESFMGTLKGEMLQGGGFADEHDSRIEIFDFIEAGYNTHRKHSSLGRERKSPPSHWLEGL